MKSIRQLAKEHNVESSMVFERIRKGWTIDEALQPKGWKRPIDIQKKINEYDNELVYLGGYESKTSKIELYCKRCGTTFERTYGRLSEKSREGKLCCEICQRKNIEQIDTTKEREEKFVNTLAITKPTYTYISGYINNDSKVLVKCNICGNEMYYSADRLKRKNSNIICKNCVSLELKQQKEQKKKINNMIKQQAKYINEIKTNKRKEIQRIYKEFKNSTLYIQKCSICGDEYVEYSKSKYCAKCRKQIRKHHSCKSLRKLYDRDNGICHICGEKCNWNDKKEVNGTIIVGERYPSIDHVIPLAKGGNDDWENIKLAHFKCNWVKGVW